MRTTTLAIASLGLLCVPAAAQEPPRASEAVRSGAPTGPGGADGRAAVAAVVAANRSWQEGRPVELEGAVA